MSETKILSKWFQDEGYKFAIKKLPENLFYNPWSSYYSDKEFYTSDFEHLIESYKETFCVGINKVKLLKFKIEIEC